ncbi:MAG: pyridoxamine 5'-phosphate oxidase family protein [Armatimonadetes bacterium]|nr:pyridoxamine 5'-phosphate oxidase family protein [Armatimonadota bacterium]
MSDQTNHEDDVKKLAQMVKGIDFGMLTTLDADGRLYSRPMAHNGNVEFDGDVWFFTYANSHKVHEIETRPQVNVSFASPQDQSYVSLAGRAELVRDKAKMQQLWDPSLRAWFPDGLDTPEIALLKINVEKAQYWDAPSSPVAHAVGLVKSLVTGQPGTVGDNQKVDLE